MQHLNRLILPHTYHVVIFSLVDHHTQHTPEVILDAKGFECTSHLKDMIISVVVRGEGCHGKTYVSGRGEIEDYFGVNTLRFHLIVVSRHQCLVYSC